MALALTEQLNAQRETMLKEYKEINERLANMVHFDGKGYYTICNLKCHNIIDNDTFQVVHCEATKEGILSWHEHKNSIETIILIEGEMTLTLENKKEIKLDPTHPYVVPQDIQHKAHSTKGTIILCIFKPPENTYNN